MSMSSAGVSDGIADKSGRCPLFTQTDISVQSATVDGTIMRGSSWLYAIGRENRVD